MGLRVFTIIFMLPLTLSLAMAAQDTCSVGTPCTTGGSLLQKSAGKSSLRVADDDINGSNAAPISCDWQTEETCHDENWVATSCANISLGGCPCPAVQHKCGASDNYAGWCTNETCPIMCDWQTEESCDDANGDATSCAKISSGGCPCSAGMQKCGATDGYSGWCQAEPCQESGNAMVSNASLLGGNGKKAKRKSKGEGTAKGESKGKGTSKGYTQKRLEAGSTGDGGSNDCQCIGINNINGTTEATLKDGAKVSYPGDLGARCEAWDATKHPSCPGEVWCQQKWCYVDPCKCKNVAALPKPSVYIPGAQYQGKPIYFSYATCGATDSYSAIEAKTTAEDITKVCEIKVNPLLWGSDKCRCVGIGPQPGFTNVSINGAEVPFPADTGATCSAWEFNRHPDCIVGDDETTPPAWCKQSWCYVDPCSCSLGVPPKTSSYLTASNFQGKPVYYSYSTCGGTDSYTSTNPNACVNQKTEDTCVALPRCGWNGNECLGKELVHMCKSGAWSLRAAIAIILPLIGIAYY